MAQLKTLVTDDISRDQTDSMSTPSAPPPPIPKICLESTRGIFTWLDGFPYKPLTLQALS